MLPDPPLSPVSETHPDLNLGNLWLPYAVVRTNDRLLLARLGKRRCRRVSHAHCALTCAA